MGNTWTFPSCTPFTGESDWLIDEKMRLEAPGVKTALSHPCRHTLAFSLSKRHCHPFGNFWHWKLLSGCVCLEHRQSLGQVRLSAQNRCLVNTEDWRNRVPVERL